MRKIVLQISLIFSFFLFIGLCLGATQSYACSTGDDCPYYQYCDGGVWPFNNGTCTNFNLTGNPGDNGTCDNQSTSSWAFTAPALGGWNGYNSYNSWPWLDGPYNNAGTACPEGIVFGKHTLGNSYCLHTGNCTTSEYSPSASNYSGSPICEVYDTNPASQCGYEPYGDFNVYCSGNYQCTNYQGCELGGIGGPCPGIIPYCACVCPAHIFCQDNTRTSTGFSTYSGDYSPCTNMWCAPYCTTGGPTNCGAWNINENNNTCGTIYTSRTCQHDTNPNGSCVITSASNYTDWGYPQYNYCTANYTCPNINGTGPENCITHIYAYVYTDYNHDGSKNGNDAGKSGVTVTDGSGPQTTDSSGETTFSGETTGNYTITMTVPANFQAIGGASHGVSLTNSSGNVTVNFYLTPLYSISGNIFNDKNKDQKYDGSDTLYTSSTGTIHITGGPTTVSDITVTNGTWATPTNLESGTYNVQYSTTLAGGYNYTTSSSYTVVVGNPTGSPACNTGSSPDATCGGTNNGSIANLNVGLTNENPWQQSVCYDVRDDSGSYTDQIPAAPACGGVSGAYDSVVNGDCSTGAGIIFTCNATPDFGLGSANANSWEAGGPSAAQQECYSGVGLDVVRTSYEYLETTAQESNITPTDLSTYCNLSSCTLPGGFPKGIYQANGDLHMNTYTFPVDPNNPQAFVILVNGDLYIDGNILVPAGSVAAFSTSGSIYVDKSVGNVITDPSDPAVNNPNIEGLYSADKNFIIQSYGSGTNLCNSDGTPLDKKLNIVGSIVTNANQQGGAYTDNRDLCIYDLDCSTGSTGDGNPDGSGTNDEGLAVSYVMTLFADGSFLNHKTFNWEELKP